MRNLFRSLLVQRDAERLVFIEGHRVGIRESERGDILITFRASDRTLADAFDDGLGIFGTAVRADPCNERVAREPAFHRFIIA